MYAIHATVDAAKLKADWGVTMQGMVDIPEFLVDADNQDDALVMAKLIIDPLRMTDTHITAAETPRPQYHAALEEDLDAALKALRGDSNDAEHDALNDIAGDVAALLERDDWDELRYADEDEEDE